MKKILQMSFADVNDKHIPKKVNIKNISLENNRLVSFSAVILEGVYKNTKIDFLYINYNGSHVDFRTSYEKIFKDGIQLKNNNCDVPLNCISGNIALTMLYKQQTF